MAKLPNVLQASTLAKAQDVANQIDHEDHDLAVKVALEVAAPLIAAQAVANHERTHTVLGRAHWDSKHCSNWMLFAGITAYKNWARELRAAMPEVRCEYALLSIPGPEAILSNARAEARQRHRELGDLL